MIGWWLGCASPAVVDAPVALTVEAAGPVATRSVAEHHATVALGAGGEALVAYMDGRTVSGVWATGGEPWALANGAGAAYPQVVADEDGYWVAMTAQGVGLALRALDEAGQPSGEPLLVPTERPARYADLAVDPWGRGLLAFSEGGAVRVFRLDAQEAWSRASAGAGTVSIVEEPAGFRLAWSELQQASIVTLVAPLDADGASRGPVEVVDQRPWAGTDARPTVASSEVGWALAWRHGHDVEDPEAWLAVYGLGDRPLALHALPGARRPVVAAEPDRYWLAWEQRADGRPQIWARGFSAHDGRALGPAVRVSPDDGAAHERPALALRDGEGVITWERSPGLDVWAATLRVVSRSGR